MLDRLKITQMLHNVATDLFIGFAQEIDIARQVWAKICQDHELAQNMQATKQSLLIPWWSGLLGGVVKIAKMQEPYVVTSVDGSQIYYDKHQGPPCFLINVGFMQLRYGVAGKAVIYGTQPFLTTKFDATNDFASPEFVNMQREGYEFDCALQLMQQVQAEGHDAVSVCLFDGSLIFFHLDAQDGEQQALFLQQYCTVLEQFRQQKMLIAGYMSLPRSKELVNLCKLELGQGDERLVCDSSVIDRLTDVDIAHLYLQPQERSIIFKSKAPICYAYPKDLQPHFCYLHVGSEIVRVEFPAWIAQSPELVDQICAVACDQAAKGCGYPVSLFEAHEQAVVKAQDRNFFYQLIEQLSLQRARQYQLSQKSIKKQRPIL